MPTSSPLLRVWSGRLRRLLPVDRPPRKVFERIYRARRWGDVASGPGSSLLVTATLRSELPSLLRRHRVERLLDWPCGDLNWMAAIDLGGVEYVGADVVPGLVEANRERFPEREFRVLDLLADPPPRSDLILCRDVLVHLTFRQIRAALANLRRAPGRLLLTTTFPGLEHNHNVATGGWRPINLERRPFDLPPPEEVLDEGLEELAHGEPVKKLGLWRLDQLPELSGD